MAAHLRCDIDKIDVFCGEHCARVAIGFGAKLFGRRFGLRAIKVAHGDEIGAFGSEIRPRMKMVLGVETASNQTNSRPLLLWHFLSSRPVWI